MVSKNKNDQFKNIHTEEQNIWNKYFNISNVTLKNYTFDFQIKTNGYDISVLFISPDGKLKKDKKKECFRKGRENTNEQKMNMTENEIKAIINAKNEAIIKKKNEQKLKAKENIKKKKAEFKKLPKEDQQKVIAERKLNAEFIYIEELVKYDIMREKLKKQLDAQILVYGDPGKRSPLYLLGENGKYFNYTNKMRLHETKRLKYTQLITNKKKKMYVNEKTVEEIESTLSVYNSKSCILKNFEEYIKKKLSVNLLLKTFYIDTYFRKLNWFTYLNTHRHESKLMDKLKNTFGRKENNEELQARIHKCIEKNMRYKHPGRLKPKQREHHIAENPVFIIGDWNDKQGLKYMSTPGIGLKRRLAEEFTVHTIDEYRTSKLHYKHEVECENYKAPYKSICKEDNTVKEGTQSIHSILIYKLENKQSGCINRDKNSVLNMKKIVENLISTQERPEKYKRTCKPSQLGVNYKRPDQRLAISSKEEGAYRVCDLERKEEHVGDNNRNTTVKKIKVIKPLKVKRKNELVVSSNVINIVEKVIDISH